MTDLVPTSGAKPDSLTAAQATQNGKPVSIPRWRKVLYGLIACAGFFVALEAVLWLAGVRTLLDTSDPHVGFNGRYQLFVPRERPDESLEMRTARPRLGLFNFQTFPLVKGENVRRVFCLGGSTTYGRPYDDQTSFAGFLRAFLPAIDLSSEWEVINAGGISYATPRIAILLDELLQYDPDLFVIYTGHNEFLEDQTYASLKARPSVLREVEGGLAHSRLYSMLHRALHGDATGPTDGSGMSLDEVHARLDDSIGPAVYERNDAHAREIVREFERNLRRMVERIQQAGTKVVLVTPASKLRDCSPFKSEHAAGLSEADQLKFTARLSAARDSLDAEDSAAALREVDAALEIDRRHADAHFLRGQALWKLERFDEAREAFTRAREEDVCPLRALDDIVQAVRDVGTDTGAVVVDYAAVIAERSEHGTPGEDWFLDHVHPTIAGHQLLAEQLCLALEEDDWLDADESWEPAEFARLGAEVEASVDEETHVLALLNLAKVLSWAGKSDEADRLVAKAAPLLPTNIEMKTLAGNAALREKNYDEAERLFQAARNANPDDAQALVGLGKVYFDRQEFTKGLPHLRRAVDVAPSRPIAWFYYGSTLLELGDNQHAATALRRSLDLQSAQPDAHRNLAKALVGLGDVGNAVKHAERAVALEPQDAARRADLGFFLIDAGREADALQQFDTALRLDPDSAMARVGRALVFINRGKVSTARGLLQEAAALDPENAGIRNLLDSLKP